jgi:hypothetical protein
VVQDAGAIDDVEGARPQARSVQLRLDEPDPLDPEASGRLGGELERGARQVRADDQPVAGGEEQAHLAGPAADLEHRRVRRDRLVEEPRELAPLGAGAQCRVVVSRRVSREGSRRVEVAHRVRPRVELAAQVRDPVRDPEDPSACAAAHVRTPRAKLAPAGGAGGEGEQLARQGPHQKME